MMNETLTKLTISKKDLNSAVLFFFICTSVLIPAGLFSFLMLCYLIIWLMATAFRVPRDVLSISLPIILLISVGLINSFGKETYNIAKDVWYVGKSLLALLIGYLIMLNIGDLRNLLKTILYSATFASLFHITALLTHPQLFRQSLYEFRSDVGLLFYVVSIGIAIIPASRRFSLTVFRKHRWLEYIVMLLSITSLLLSFSRTMLFIMIIMFLIIFDLLKVKYLNKAIILILLTASLASFTLVPIEEEETTAYRTFIAKVGYTLQEILVRDYEDPREITLHWRGFESYKALQTYQSGNWLNYMIGHGFGTLIDLGSYVQLGEEEFRDIPVLHNGYMYLLVKTGLLGVFIYILFFYKIISYAKRTGMARDGDVRLAGKFIIAISLIILATTVGIAGFFNKSALLPFIIILGSLLAYIKSRTGSSAFGRLSGSTVITSPEYNDGRSVSQRSREGLYSW